VATLERRQGVKISCPEEIAFIKGFISSDDFAKLATNYGKGAYGDYLRGRLEDFSVSI
jgi:glucose-1-phosphate thymidylyltransferase